MKPDSSLLWRISFQILVVGIALGLVGIVADATAGIRNSYAPTTDAADVSISSDIVAAEPCLVVITVTAANSNGPIASLTANLSDLPPGNDATFVTDATNTTGTLIWHPGVDDRNGFVVFTATTANGQSVSSAELIDLPKVIQARGSFQWNPTVADIGTYTITFLATASDGETTSLVWPITVVNRSTAAPNPTTSYQRLSPQAPTRGPIVSIVPCEQCGGEGAEVDTVDVASPTHEYFAILLNVTDPDGESIVALTADLSGLPPGNTATFWASLGATAKAGGPYAGVVGVPVEFNGGASSGSPLTWDFGDSKSGIGVMPSHTYTAPGTYRVTLVVDGPDVGGPLSLADCDATSVVISDGLAARAFVADGHRGTPDTSGGQPLCIQIEPVNGDYDNTQVDLSTIVMYSGVPGSTAYAAALSGKTMVAGDRDRNGIQEITACFAPEALRSFLDDMQGRQTLPVTIVAEVETGGTLRASLDLNLVRTGKSLAGSVHPNPLHQAGTVVFETSKPGPIKILLFDLHGRLVRTLLDQTHAAGGRHEVPIDGRDARGRRLASGIYLYRVQAAEGVATGRLMILQ
ncbi:MAG TPA: PKD domain-containing protein [Candidatus Eisenbacteria bacterium]